MKNRSHFLLTSFFSLLVIINIKLYPQEINYDIFQLNLGAAVPYAMNDSTEVVGVYQDGGGVWIAFHWAKGVFTPLSPGLFSQALSINNNSEIVGRENDLAHYWSEDTTFSLLLPGTTYSSANGINNLGNIVGYSGATAFYYDGTMNALSNPSGYLGSLAKAINDLNTIVGYTIDDSQTNNGAVRWQNGVPVLLDTSYRNAKPNSVNNQNVTVGYFDGSGRWGRAFMWVDNTVTVLPILPGYDDANCFPYDINDSNIIVGVCGGGPGVNRAWIWKDGVMDDLNNQIPPDSNITLNIAWSINNKGEIVCSGYTPGYVTHHYLLKPITIDITKPKQSDKWMAGETDTIRWTGGKANEVIKIKYSTDAGNNFELIDAGINVTDTMYVWDIPDTLLGRRSLIRIERNSDSEILAESDTFKIKPYIITRVENGEYVAYDINTDKWGFWNDEPEMWPQIYWQRFDYNGIDPITNKRYSRWQGDSVFTKANSSDHPDWKSFVGAFGVDACYADTYIGIYQPKALTLWEGNKGIWGGSCFGIAISNALAFEMRSEFQSAYPNFPAITSPILVTTDTNVVKVANELYTHQYGNPHEANLGIALQKTPNQTLNELRDLLREDNVKIRTLSFLSNDPLDKGGHAIVGYKITKDVNIDDRYYIYVYDNSNPNVLNAYIRVDSLANAGNGGWYTPYAWQNWGGDKWLFLEDTASTFFANPILPQKSKVVSPFVLSENELQVLPSSDLTPMIIDSQGNQTGIGTSGMVIGIPGSFPLIARNGSSGPPYGYYLQTDNYSITLNNFLTESANTLLLTGNKLFEYERSGATQAETDRLFFDGGLSVTNPDQEVKQVKLLNITTTTDDEKVFILRTIELAQNDSVKIENPDDNRLNLISYGSAKNYQIELNQASELGIGRFLNSNISLPQNTTHNLVPNWGDFADLFLTIYVDEGNNGTIDDTLYLENEVTGIGDDQGLLLPTDYRLEQNYPNPFNNSTIIKYSIPKEGLVNLKVYSILGKEVATLVDEFREAGRYEVEFDASILASGIYFYRLQAGSFIETKKMILLK